MSFFSWLITNKRSTRLLLAALAVLLVSGGLYGFVWFSIREKQKETKDVFATLEKEIKDERLFRTLKRLLATTRAEREELASRFVTTSQIALYLEEIEALGDSADVAVSFETVTFERRDRDVLRVILSGNGTFSGLFHFVTLLEAMPKKIAFESISFRKEIVGARAGEEARGPWNTRISFLLMSFIQE